MATKKASTKTTGSDDSTEERTSTRRSSAPSESEREEMRARGIDADTGDRRAVTLQGAREEFGHQEGTRLYNSVSVAGFGGVQSHLPDLDLVSLREQGDRAQMRGESDQAYEAALQKKRERAERVEEILHNASKGRF